MPCVSRAQMKLWTDPTSLPHSTLDKAQQEEQAAKLRQEYPLFFRINTAQFAKRQNERTKISPAEHARRIEAVKKAFAQANAPLWGNMVDNSTWTTEPYFGMYSFYAQHPQIINELGLDKSLYASGGSCLKDGKFYVINADFTYASSGYIFAGRYIYDAKTWKLLQRDPILGDVSYIAFATAYDKKSKTVYGQFINADMQTLDWGTIDYETLQRTNFGKGKEQMCALGITSDGKLYGVGIDGNLYSIDKSNGKETLVGATGLVITNDKGTYNQQSGEIDQKTNTFYWAATDKDGNSGLYTINLTTGKATKIADFPHHEYFLGLTIPDDTISDNAPDLASNITASFDGASTNGSISFVAPSQTFQGNALTGQLTYYIYANGSQLATGSVTAGATATAQVSTKSGMNHFTVVTENNAGKSPEAILNKWVGYDVPSAPDSVTLDIDNSGKTTVTWQKSDSSLNGGFIGNLAYDVYRISNNDTVKVASNVNALTYSENLPKDKISKYGYGIVAVNSTEKSDMAYSGKLVYGPAVEGPYVEDFSGNDPLNFYTVVDANNDGTTWKLDYAGRLAYSSSFKNAADDWIITPAVHLENGKAYKVTVRAHEGSSSYKEQFEVKAGMGQHVSDMSLQAIPTTTVTATLATGYANNNLTVPETGDYHFGIHCISPKSQYYLYLDGFSVEAVADSSSPDSVINATLEPGAEGEKNATISFKAPVNAQNGSALKSNLSKITISRGIQTVKTFTNVVPGTELNFMDNDITEDGAYSYTIVPFDSHNYGKRITISRYVGNDVPQIPTGLRINDMKDSLVLTWNAVPSVGANGGYVNPDEVTYKIEDLNWSPGDTLYLGKGTRGVTKRNVDEGNQRTPNIGIVASNSKGAGQYYSEWYVTGKPYAMPFEESFAGGSAATLAAREYNGGSVSYSRNSSVDNDGGTVLFSFYSKGSAKVNLGKIALEGSDNPVLIFSHKGVPGNDNQIKVALHRPNGDIDTIKTVDYKSINGEQRWIQEKVPLTSYKSDRYARFTFIGYGGNANTSVNVDQIGLYDLKDRDLQLTLDASQHVKKGSKCTVSTTIKNIGDQTANGFTVSLFNNGKLVADTTVTDTLITLQSKKYSFDIPTSITDTISNMVVQAEVAFSHDDNTANNLATADIALYGSDAPTVENVSATATDGNSVSLKWDAPKATDVKVTDDFENYNAWSTNFGDWTLDDEDKGSCGRIVSLAQYPGQGTPFAYIIFNPERLYPGLTSMNTMMKPHSGSQSALALNSLQYGYYPVDNNDWLISPLLSGKAQNISFWATNVNSVSGSNYPETFEVMVSSDSTDVKSFTAIGEDRNLFDGKWTEFNVSLSAGTKYFAIHHKTSGSSAYMFCIDDVTYERGYGKPVRYNIYRDGVLVGTVSAPTTSFNSADNNADGHSYAVTAVYADGSESDPVSASVITGITEIGSEQMRTFDVYTIDGIRVRAGVSNLNGLSHGIYIVNGKKMIK